LGPVGARARYLFRLGQPVEGIVSIGLCEAGPGNGQDLPGYIPCVLTGSDLVLHFELQDTLSHLQLLTVNLAILLYNLVFPLVQEPFRYPVSREMNAID